MDGQNGSMEGLTELFNPEIYRNGGKWISYGGTNGNEIGLLVENNHAYGILTWYNGDIDARDVMIHVYRKADASLFNGNIFQVNRDKDTKPIGPVRKMSGDTDIFKPYLDVLIRALEQTGWSREGAKRNAQLKPIEVQSL